MQSVPLQSPRSVCTISEDSVRSFPHDNAPCGGNREWRLQLLPLCSPPSLAGRDGPIQSRGASLASDWRLQVFHAAVEVREFAPPSQSPGRRWRRVLMILSLRFSPRYLIVLQALSWFVRIRSGRFWALFPMRSALSWLQAVQLLVELIFSW